VGKNLIERRKGMKRLKTKEQLKDAIRMEVNGEKRQGELMYYLTHLLFCVGYDGFVTELKDIMDNVGNEYNDVFAKTIGELLSRYVKSLMEETE